MDESQVALPLVAASTHFNHLENLSPSNVFQDEEYKFVSISHNYNLTTYRLLSNQLKWLLLFSIFRSVYTLHCLLIQGLKGLLAKRFQVPILGLKRKGKAWRR